MLSSFYREIAPVLGRLIVAAVFLVGVAFKVMMPAEQAAYIEAVGIPFGSVLIWIAALFELWVGLSVLTGKWFRPVVTLAIPYILFLAVMFHGPNTWAANQLEFGFFIDHFIFITALLFMGAYGPGRLSLSRK